MSVEIELLSGGDRQLQNRHRLSRRSRDEYLPFEVKKDDEIGDLKRRRDDAGSSSEKALGSCQKIEVASLVIGADRNVALQTLIYLVVYQ